MIDSIALRCHAMHCLSNSAVLFKPKSIVPLGPSGRCKNASKGGESRYKSKLQNWKLLFHTVSLSHTVLAWLMRGAWFKGNLCCCIRPVHWGKGWNIRLQLRQFTKEAKAKKPEINDKPTSFRIAMMFTAEVVAGAWLSYLEDGFHIFLTLMIVIGMIMFGGDRENWPNYQYTCLAIYTMTLPLKGAQGKHTWRLVPSFLIPFLHSIHWDFATLLGSTQFIKILCRCN